jgi:hypothetical protein
MTNTDHVHIKRHADGEWQIIRDGLVIATLDNGDEALARDEAEIKRDLADMHDRLVDRLLERQDEIATRMSEAHQRGDLKTRDKHIDELTDIFRSLCRQGIRPFFSRSKWQ